MAEKNYVQSKDYYYTKGLKEKEIAEYIEVQLNYYKTKYIDFYIILKKIKFEENLNQLEKKLVII